MQFDGIFWPQLKGIQDGEYKLDRTRKALEALGNPHYNLQNIIHIAGTNGKGSTTAFLKSVLNANGFLVNIYTSPHLVSVHERIQIHSQNITDEALIQNTSEVYRTLKNVDLEDSLTYFEAMTVIAFHSFAKNKADFNIIEVGLGGRFDATNVVGSPLLSIITSISLDHTDYLGDTLEKIAVEKCEIIKPNSHAVMTFQKSQGVRDVFTQKCNSVSIDGVVCQEIRQFNNGLASTFQSQNATTVLKALEIIGHKIHFNFEEEKSIQAMLQTKWRGRMETVFVNQIQREILVDCAHNFDGISKFIEFIGKQSGRKALVFGMLSRKIREDIFLFLRNALNENLLDAIITVNFGQDGECFPSNELSNSISHERCFSAEDFPQALNFAKDFDQIFLCGSIHLVGDFFAQYKLYNA